MKGFHNVNRCTRTEEFFEYDFLSRGFLEIIFGLVLIDIYTQSFCSIVQPSTKRCANTFPVLLRFSSFDSIFLHYLSKCIDSVFKFVLGHRLTFVPWMLLNRDKSQSIRGWGQDAMNEVLEAIIEKSLWFLTCKDIPERFRVIG